MLTLFVFLGNSSDSSNILLKAIIYLHSDEFALPFENVC